MPTNRPSWRIIPSDFVRVTVEAMAKRQGRSIASMCNQLLSRELDRQRLDAAVDAAGLTKARRILEGAAIAAKRDQVFGNTPVDLS